MIVAIFQTLYKTRRLYNAWLMHLADNLMDRIYGRLKRKLYRNLPTTVVEIGPGAGANFRYYPPGINVIAIEPNIALHPHLKARALKYDIALDIKPIRGEAIDLPDNSVSAIVGTLVLCTVNDPQQVISEIRRILQPGGRYIFVEHVAAMLGSKERKFQDYLHPLWHRLFEGCHLNRNTQQTINQAGFASVTMNRFNLQPRWLPFRPHIFGSAVN